MSDVQKINIDVTGIETDVFGIEEACEYLKLARSTVYRLTRKGIIPHNRIGKSLRFRKEVLAEWLQKDAKARTTAQTTKASKKKTTKSNKQESR